MLSRIGPLPQKTVFSFALHDGSLKLVLSEVPDDENEEPRPIMEMGPEEMIPLLGINLHVLLQAAYMLSQDMGERDYPLPRDLLNFAATTFVSIAHELNIDAKVTLGFEGHRKTATHRTHRAETFNGESLQPAH